MEVQGTQTSKTKRSKHWQNHLQVEQAKQKRNRIHKCKEANFKLHCYIDKWRNWSTERRKYQS